MNSPSSLTKDDLIKNLLEEKPDADASFIVFSPLYKKYSINEEVVDDFARFLSIDTKFNTKYESPIILDTFCPKCKKDSTFKDLCTLENRTDTNLAVRFKDGKRQIIELAPWLGLTEQHIYIKEFACSRDHDHVNTYIFLLTPSYVMKIGEFPSNLISETINLKKYRKHFESYHDELVVSLKIYSSGFGVGAFVYLRRIFENLVWDAYYRHKEKNNNIEEMEFKNKGMADKIEYLKNELPEFLVENKVAYSILSIGIHALEEEKCLKYYNFLKDTILLILDEEIARIEKENKKESLIKQLSNIHSTLGNEKKK